MPAAAGWTGAGGQALNGIMRSNDIYTLSLITACAGLMLPCAIQIGRPSLPSGDDIASSSVVDNTFSKVPPLHFRIFRGVAGNLCPWGTGYTAVISLPEIHRVRDHGCTGGMVSLTGSIVAASLLLLPEILRAFSDTHAVFRCAGIVKIFRSIGCSEIMSSACTGAEKGMALVVPKRSSPV